MKTLLRPLNRQLLRIRRLGLLPGMHPYEVRKLAVFNQLNFFGLLCGLIVPAAGALDSEELPLLATVIAMAPAFISATVLWMNSLGRHERARLLYFTAYPLLTATLYAAGMDVGIELFFVLYGVLSIFYLQRLLHGVLAFLLSGACYLMAVLGAPAYTYILKEAHFPFFAANHIISLTFLFFAVFWIKRENYSYQTELAAQTGKLQEADRLKNKIFSVIAHDLRGPIHGIHNLFRSVDRYGMSEGELKALVPDILRDLNFTTALMENLLQWAKSQMQAETLRLRPLHAEEVAESVVTLFTSAARAKNIRLCLMAGPAPSVVADPDLLHLVLRNLVSNALKFTAPGGIVTVLLDEGPGCLEVSVQDTGRGMSSEVLSRLQGANFYTTQGTGQETGTGLGLMLCRDFLQKMGSRLFIESTPGVGTICSFSLSWSAAEANTISLYSPPLPARCG